MRLDVREDDFGGTFEPHGGLVARISQRNHRLRDNFGDRIPELMRAAGLVDAAEVGHRVTRTGRHTYWSAVRPAA